MKPCRALLNLLITWTGCAAALAQAPSPAPAPAPAQDAQELAKQLSNPIASLVSVPFQLNWDFGVGPAEDMRFLMNFQPVMPFALNEDWNLIARVIVPIVSQPALTPGGAAASGIGDILFSSFFSPAKPGRTIWGVGPALQLPVSAEPTLGTEQWALGPTFVVLEQRGPWTYGMLANHLWSLAGESDRPDVNQTFLQPFVAFGAKHAVTYTLQSEITANWEASGGDVWTVPINVLVSKVAKLGRKPISVGAGAGYYAHAPDGGPEWKFRSVVTLLLPTK